MMHWSATFVGIPHLDKGRTREGADCWGLCRLVLAERASVELPSYDGLYSCPAERSEVAAIVAAEEKGPLWHRVEGEPHALDIVFFKQGQHSSHCGVVVEPGLMLHSARTDCAKIERFRPAPIGMRWSGAYRWHELAGARP